MGGVDRSDQMTTSYPTERKRLKTWYKKHFMHLISMSPFNAHIINKKGDKLDALNFRKKLFEQIVEKYGTEVESSVKCRERRTSLEGSPFRLIGKYFLILIPPTDK